MAKNKMQNKTQKKVVPVSTGIDIVIPVYGRFDLLEKCLNSIPDSTTRPYRVILVDNSSPDKDMAKKFYATYSNKYHQLLINHENRGFPFACNRGAKSGNNPYIFFLNSDVILSPGSLDRLVSELDKDHRIGIAGMMLLFPDYAEGLRADTRPAGKVQHVGLEMNQKGNFIHMYVGWSADNPKVLARRDSYAVTGAALLVRRELFMKAGMFDLAYGLGTWEDVDLCVSIRDMGYNIVVVPEAQAVHYTGATAEFYRMGYPLQVNMVHFMSKWQKKLNVTSWRYH